MSAEENKELVRRLVDELWNQHDPAAVDRFFGPGLREEVAGHYRQLLTGFPELQVTVEDDLIAVPSGSEVNWAGGEPPRARTS